MIFTNSENFPQSNFVSNMESKIPLYVNYILQFLIPFLDAKLLNNFKYPSVCLIAYPSVCPPFR